MPAGLALQHRGYEDTQPSRIRECGGLGHPPVRYRREPERSWEDANRCRRGGIRDGESERRCPEEARSRPPSPKQRKRRSAFLYSATEVRRAGCGWRSGGGAAAPPPVGPAGRAQPLRGPQGRTRKGWGLPREYGAADPQDPPPHAHSVLPLCINLTAGKRSRPGGGSCRGEARGTGPAAAQRGGFNPPPGGRLPGPEARKWEGYDEKTRCRKRSAGNPRACVSLRGTDTVEDRWCSFRHGAGSGRCAKPDGPDSRPVGVGRRLVGPAR